MSVEAGAECACHAAVPLRDVCTGMLRSILRLEQSVSVDSRISDRAGHTGRLMGTNRRSMLYATSTAQCMQSANRLNDSMHEGQHLPVQK